jgi:hypothetical protein
MVHPQALVEPLGLPSGQIRKNRETNETGCPNRDNCFKSVQQDFRYVL